MNRGKPDKDGVCDCDGVAEHVGATSSPATAFSAFRAASFARSLRAAASIAAESGVDDFLAEATPEDKLALIRNHELSPGANGGGVLALPYDTTAAGVPLPGGTTTLVVGKVGAWQCGTCWRTMSPSRAAGIMRRVSRG